MRDPFLRRQMRREASARAMPERIAGGQHRGRPAAAREHAGRIERHRPGLAAAVDAGELQVPLAAEHGLGRSERLSACIRQPGKAIFADTDDGQPGNSTGFRHARPHSGRNGRRQPARGRTSCARRSTRSIPMRAGRRFRSAMRCRRGSAALAARLGSPISFAAERITHVIDATHPFAAEMSRHAVEACDGDRHSRCSRWSARRGFAATATTGSRWRISTPRSARCPSNAPASSSRSAASTSRPSPPKPQHAYTLRFVDAPDGALPLPDADVIVSRGPFTLDGDRELMRARGIQWLVARNSGGAGARAKIDAARELGLPVIMIARPALPERPRVESVEEVLAWLGHDARLGA